MLLHNSQELDDDLGARSDEDLTLASLLGIVHGVKRIVKDTSLDHLDGFIERFSIRTKGKGFVKEMRYLLQKKKTQPTG